jgi:hypothetical protein
VKYYVKSESEGELVVPSGAQLVILFRQQFFTPDDWVRKEGSEKWRRFRDVPEYAGMMESEESGKKQFRWLLYGTTVVVFVSLLLGLLAIVT